MRVLLINPFYPISETPSPPLGLAFLAGALKRAGHAVRLLDCVVTPFSRQRLEALLQDFQPRLAGATAVTMTVDHALAVLGEIKDLDPSITTVIGGPHATFRATQILNDWPQVDAVVRGEGEYSLVALAQALNHGTGLEGVPGITFRRGARIASTPTAPPARLDDLPPPAREIIPLGRYRALGMPVSMTTSRGCPFKCIFCVGRKMVGARVRYRNPVQVADEMEQLAGLGFHQINLADDLFTANAAHCLAVCHAVRERGLRVPWTSFARVDRVSHRLLTHMGRAGCTTVSFGVESGNAEMLRRINKGITLEQVVKAVQLCLDCGIAPHASFILGLPGESPESLADTIAFGEQLRTMGVSHGFHILAPFPGTDIRECSDAYDLQILTDDWRQYHANRAVIRTAGVSPEALNAIVIDAERQFDEWLGQIDQLRAAGKATDAQAWPLVRLEHTVVIYDMMMKCLIENKGTWPAGDMDGNDGPPAVESLYRRVSGELDHPQERIRRAIGFAVDQGHLVRKMDGGQVRWSWVERLI